MNNENNTTVLEEKFGPYEDWKFDVIKSISEDPESANLLNETTVNSFLTRDNKEIHQTMLTLSFGYDIYRTNRLFVTATLEFANEKMTAEEYTKFVINELNGINLSERLWAYIAILMNPTFTENEGKEVLDAEKIKADLIEFETRLTQISIFEGYEVIQPAISVIYKIQEAYFERFNEDILVETDEFKKYCDTYGMLKSQVDSEETESEVDENAD